MFSVQYFRHAYRSSSIYYNLISSKLVSETAETQACNSFFSPNSLFLYEIFDFSTNLFIFPQTDDGVWEWIKES